MDSQRALNRVTKSEVGDKMIVELTVGKRILHL